MVRTWILVAFVVAGLVLGTITASAAHAHGTSHEEPSPTHTEPNIALSAQSHVARAPVTAAVEKRSHCPSGSGGTCCCSGDGLFGGADLFVIACALLLWFMVPRVRAARHVFYTFPRPFDRKLAAAQPRAPPISR
jgi:hypothetical protein